MRLFSLLCLLLPVLLLAGCGTNAGASNELRIWYATDDPAERVWAQTLAQRFEATHPQVHVALTAYSFEDLNTKLQLSLDAGNPPDLAYVTPRGPGIPLYVQQHRLRDLTDVARRYGWASRLRPGVLAQYNAPFDKLGLSPHHVVAVPDALAAVGVLYNRRLLQRLHRGVPRTLTAFERDVAAARRMSVTPIGIGNADGWVGDDWYLTLVNALIPPAALQAEQRLDPRFTFRHPPFVEAARLLRTWSRAGDLTPNFGSLDAQEGIDVFFRGHTLFQLISSSENPQILQDERATGLPIGVFAFPRAHGGSVMPVSGYLGWVMPRAAAHPREAMAFLNSLLSPPTARFLARHGDVPAIQTSSNGVTATWERQYLDALQRSVPGVYLDAAPISNINATMEANVELLLEGYERPSFLPFSLEKVYTSRGKSGSAARIDGEF
ncbi:MAG TPA: extracellular solute-binding protein [Chloroflexota bacterium]|nr:extracellular solute-binding protein [Chloroflexota bacterium]